MLTPVGERTLKKQTLRLPGLIALGAFLAPFLATQTQPASDTLPLMPWPDNVRQQPGRVEINRNFSVSVSGAGATDPRVKDAVQRVFGRLARQTGIPIRPQVVPASTGATLTVIVEQRDHRPPQRLGDDERYSLEVSNGRARISADAPLGVLRGVETFL